MDHTLVAHGGLLTENGLRWPSMRASRAEYLSLARKGDHPAKSLLMVILNISSQIGREIADGFTLHRTSRVIGRFGRLRSTEASLCK